MKTATYTGILMHITILLHEVHANPTLSMCLKKDRVIGSSCNIVCHVSDTTSSIKFYKNGVLTHTCGSGICGTGVSLDSSSSTATLAVAPLAFNDAGEYTCSENGVEVKGNLTVLSKIDESNINCSLLKTDVYVGDFCLTLSSLEEFEVVLSTPSTSGIQVFPNFTDTAGSCTSPENPYYVTISNISCPDNAQGETEFKMVVDLGVQLQCSFNYTCEALCKCLPIMCVGVVAAAVIVAGILLVGKMFVGMEDNCKPLNIGVLVGILVVCFVIVIAVDFGVDCRTKGCSCDVCDVRYGAGITVSCVCSTGFCLLALFILKKLGHEPHPIRFGHEKGDADRRPRRSSVEDLDAGTRRISVNEGPMSNSIQLTSPSQVEISHELKKSDEHAHANESKLSKVPPNLQLPPIPGEEGQPEKTKKGRKSAKKSKKSKKMLDVDVENRSERSPLPPISPRPENKLAEDD